MLQRKVSKYAVLILAVLTASLINEYAVKSVNYFYKDRTYLSIILTMAITVFVFLPMFGLSAKFTKRFSKEYIKQGKSIAKNSWIGLLVSFFIAIFILFILYGLIRHNVDVLKELKELF